MFKRKTNNGLLGAALIGLGFGLTAVGVALVVPACADWSLSFSERAWKKGREAVGEAADALAEVAGSASHHFEKAASKAKSAVREFAS